MASSQNGWPASPDRRTIGVQTFMIHGVSFPGGVKAGDVATVLGYVADRFGREVEPLVAGWCWGYAWRDIRGGATTSNHASGTAIDVNAPAHPIGHRDTFSPRQRDAIRSIVAACSGVVRWGGSYSSRPDDMHFEINAGVHAVAVVAARIRTPKPPPVHEEDDMSNVELLHSDSDQPTPGGKYRWGDFVFMVKYDPELPGGAVRRYVPGGLVFNRASRLLGNPVEVKDADLASIPVVPGGEIPQDLINARP
jgi:hypothetical protein